MENQTSNFRLESVDIQILRHHIYEYKKGVRNMILHTMKRKDKEYAIALLKSKKITYWASDVSDRKVNIFFGNPICIDIVKSFKFKALQNISVEQDFILGIMLGYDCQVQFERYIKRINIADSSKYKLTSAV